jgi:hypothetical protein
VFDSLFQLYQKGSLPVGVIYELFNLDSDRMADKLKEDLFTVNDATFNRMVEEINSEVGRAMVESSDIAEKVAMYLGLDYEKGSADDGGFGGGFDGGFGSADDESGGDFDLGDGDAEQGTYSEDAEADSIADQVTEELEPGASEDEVRALVDEKLGAK